MKKVKCNTNLCRVIKNESVRVGEHQTMSVRFIGIALLIVTLSMTIGKAYAYQGEKFKVGDIYYVYGYYGYSDKSVGVTWGEEAYTGDVVIPETVQVNGREYSIGWIAKDAFKGDSITSIIIPNTIESIGKEAFYGCKKLKSITIPQSVKKIDDYAFCYCTELSSASIPWGISCGSSPFFGCIKLCRTSDKAMIDITMNVIDTLEVERIFNEEKKPSIQVSIQELQSELKMIQSLYSKKKLKTPEELDIALHAYEYYKTNKGYYETDPDISYFLEGKMRYIYREMEKYERFLADSLEKEREKLEKGWKACLSEREIPYKEVTKNTRNWFYRGYNFSLPWFLDMLDITMQRADRKGHEFLNSKSQHHKDLYPIEMEYDVYEAAPDYKARGGCVYDGNGRLVSYPDLGRNDDAIRNIERLLYLRDYQNNKYNVKSASKNTQDYIKYVLSDKENLRITLRDFDKKPGYHPSIDAKIDNALINMYGGVDFRTKREYKDDDGDNFIKQVRKDHADELGYIYIIERITNLSFRVVYINKQTLEPSCCGIITYETGSKPYTYTYSAELADIPTNIPTPIR